MGNMIRTSVSHRDANNNVMEDDKNTIAEKNHHRPCRHLIPRKSSFRVDLTLMDISEEATDDPHAFDLLRNSQVGIWKTACCAETFLKRPMSRSTTEEAKDVQKRVSRFLKTSDKYLACASMLFKSLAFHDVYSATVLQDLRTENDNDGDGDVSGIGVEKQKRPVVELPRTEYRKPYIPLPRDWRNDMHHSTKEEDVFSMSISHQFPFVALSKIKSDCQAFIGKGNKKSFVVRNPAISSTMPSPIVGLDIVVFEKFNARIYSSEEEFLEVFRDQFTQNEWENGIQNPQLGTTTMRLREFYIRWAMKEAYTKAIGVGMGLEFNGFEIHLEETGEDNNNNNISSNASIWSRIRKNREAIPTTPTRPECFRGTIAFSNKSDNEYFYFYFLPLVSKPTNADSNETMDGCACVCVGSFQVRHHTDDDDDEWKSRIDISWINLEELWQSHQSH